MKLARLILLLATLSLLAAFVLPHQVGMLVARALSAEQAPWRLLASDRGWRSARYLLEVPIRGSESPLRLEFDVRHGPRFEAGRPGWLFGTIRVSRDSPVQVRDWQGRSALELLVQVTPGGSVDFSPALARADAQPIGRIRYDMLPDTLTGVISLAGLRVTTPTQDLLLGRMNADMDLHRAPEGWEGELGLAIARLGLVRETRGWMVDGLSLRLRRAMMSGGREDLQLNFTLDSFSRSGETVGPFALLAGGRGIERRFWPASYDVGRQFMAILDSGQSLVAAVAQVGLRDWSALLAPLGSARLNLDALQLNFPQGGLHLSGDLIGPDLRDPLFDRGEDRWRISGQLRVSPTLLEQGVGRWLGQDRGAPRDDLAARIIGRLDREGWIVADQGDWISSINRLEGNWWFNGKLADAQALGLR
ncbi:MAG: hypothetical protein ACOC00_05185 [Halothiobacillaceae bacterium]